MTGLRISCLTLETQLTCSEVENSAENVTYTNELTWNTQEERQKLRVKDIAPQSPVQPDASFKTAVFSTLRRFSHTDLHSGGIKGFIVALAL